MVEKAMGAGTRRAWRTWRTCRRRGAWETSWSWGQTRLVRGLIIAWLPVLLLGRWDWSAIRRHGATSRLISLRGRLGSVLDMVVSITSLEHLRDAHLWHSVSRIGCVRHHALCRGICRGRLRRISRGHRSRIRGWDLPIELTRWRCHVLRMRLLLRHPSLLLRTPVRCVLVPRIKAIRVVTSLLAPLSPFPDI